MAGQVGAQPTRGLLTHPAQHLDDDVLAGWCRPVTGVAEPFRGERGGVESGRGRLVGPRVVQCGGVDAVGLGGPGGEHGGSFQAGDGARVGVVAVVFGAPPVDQLADLDVDLGAALREHRPHPVGDGGEVGLAAVDGVPGDTESVGELGAQGGVVDPADGSLLVLQEPGIQRQPPAVDVLDLGGDDGVGVQLRVHRPRRVLTEQRRCDALGVDLVDPVAAPAGDRPMRLEPPERGVDCGVVSGEDLGAHPPVRADCPQGRHRLGCRERRIKPPSRGFAEPTPKRLAGLRVAALEQRPQIDSGDVAAEADGVESMAEPPARRLVRIEVVVDRPPPGTVHAGLVVGEAGVVGEQPVEPIGRRLERRHPHHRSALPGRNAPVCPTPPYGMRNSPDATRLVQPEQGPKRGSLARWQLAPVPSAVQVLMPAPSTAAQSAHTPSRSAWPGSR